MMMNPLSDIDKTFSLVIQQERELNSVLFSHSYKALATMMNMQFYMLMHLKILIIVNLKNNQYKSKIMHKLKIRIHTVPWIFLLFLNYA